MAILYSAPDEEAQGPTAAAPRDTGVIDNFVDRQHLALIDVSGGALHVVSPPELYVFEMRVGAGRIGVGRDSGRGIWQQQLV